MATSMAVNRVRREIQELRGSTEVKVTVPDDANMCRLEGEITGPSDTPYAGGIYKLDIVIVPKYPFNPPEVKFVTKIWHPNVSSVTGTICLDILKSEWYAGMTLRTVLLSIQALLTSPNPEDPQDAVVAKQILSDPDFFRKTARHWALAYAGAPASDARAQAEEADKLARLVAMGFAETEARAALSSNGWNVEAAVEYLTS
jgi:ubiquitin-conjugating enzyme (huntingtin interacting protein 2)